MRIASAALLLSVIAGGSLASQQPGASTGPLEPAIPVARAWPTDSSWRHIGPAAFGGRIDDIEAVPADPRIIFVATASGGLFRSTNGGTTWTAVSDGQFATLSVGDVAIAPSDARIVWAGMGEPNNRQSSTWGDGVYKSTDGGTTWRHMGLRETQTIARVLVDPRDPDVIFVAAVGHLFGPNEERGVFRTRDGGRTWQKVLFVDANTGATDLVMSPDGRTLLAAMYQRRRRAFAFAGSGPGSGVWRSTDGGDTWERVTAGLPTTEMGRIGLDLSKSDPRIVYAVVEARAGTRVTERGDTVRTPGSGVYRSDDGGASWTFRSATNPRPSYFSKIRVDPRDPERVWLGGVALTMSTDGGRTFTTDSVAQHAHADHHAIWIDPANPEHVLLGNDGGVYSSRDRGRTWIYHDNLPIAQFYDIAIDDREPYWIYGGTQDNGSWAFPSETFSEGGMTNAEIRNTVYGDGFQASVDPLDRRFVYANSQNGRIFLADIETREARFIQPSPPAGSEPYRFNWNTGNHQSPNDPRTYYLGAQKLLKTTNRGETWEEISPDLTRKIPRGGVVGPGFQRQSLSANDGTSNYGNITTISESPRAPGTIYVGTDDGNVQRTPDGGRTWTDLTSRFPFPDAERPASYVSKVYASRHDAQSAYVAFDGHWDDEMRPYVFRTADGGATWQSIAGDLPDWKPVKTIEEDPRDPHVLYVGTEFGLYWTTDGGAHWRPAPGNVPPVIVTKIIADPRSDDLIAATHGRGVLILDGAAALAAGNPSSWREGVRLFVPDTATQYARYRQFPIPGSDEFQAPNPPIGAYITYGLNGEAPRSRRAEGAGARITVHDADGAVVAEMRGPDASGMHRVLWDLRYQFAYVPPPGDSGFYGPPKSAFVPPGHYTVKLAVRGRELEQPMAVRWDPRGPSTPEALRARFELNVRGRDVAATYALISRTLDSLAAELDRAASAGTRRRTSATDSTIAALRTQLGQLRTRAAAGVRAFPGGIFDLLAAVEASSLPPTEPQRRLMDAIEQNSSQVVTAINQIITTNLPALRRALGQSTTSRLRPISP